MPTPPAVPTLNVKRTASASQLRPILSTNLVSAPLAAHLLILIYWTGGVVVEQDENQRLVAKPYDVNEANK